MADTLKEFLVSIGFAVDSASQSKVEASVNKAEATITAATQGGDKKRTDSAKTEAIKREKIETEAEKKARERREKSLKEIQANVVKMTAFVAKAALAIQATAGGIFVAVNEAAKSFEQLNYSAQRIGGSAKGVTAVEYAISQLGGTTDGARQSLENFGDKLKINPTGYLAFLKSLGVATTDAQGHILKTEDLYTNFLQTLAKKPYAFAQGIAKDMGTDELTRMAGGRPELGKLIADRKAQQDKIGANVDDAAKSGTLFEQSMRRLLSVMSDISTKVETSLFVKLKPQLDQLAQWATDHGEHIANVLTRIAEDIIKFAKAVMEDLAKINWDAVLGGIEKAIDAFSRWSNAITGQGGIITALEALAAYMAGAWALKMTGGIAQVVKAFAPLAAMLGLASAAADKGLLQPPKDFSAEGVGNFLEPGMGTYLFGKKDGQQKPEEKAEQKPADSRTWMQWLQQALPSWAGGLKISGSPVSQANPLPVKLAGSVESGPGGFGSGGGFGGGGYGGGSGDGGTSRGKFGGTTGKKNIRYGAGGTTPGPGSGFVTPDTKLSDLDAKQQDDFVKAMGKTEGNPGALPAYNNPGNIKYGSYALAHGATGQGLAGVAMFPNAQAGSDALKNLIFGKNSNYAGMTLSQAMQRYTPAGDGANDPNAKARMIAKMIGAPAPLPISSVATDTPEVASARHYLEATASGNARTRGDSITKLNPAFAVKAAQLVKWARENGMPNAGVFSGYRTPTQTGTGYDAAGLSGHSYGIASDFSGIGVAGSETAKAFDAMAHSLGLGGYGPNNHNEFNHKELLPLHLEKSGDYLNRLKATLGPHGEMSDPAKTWAATGVPVPDSNPMSHINAAAAVVKKADEVVTSAAKVVDTSKQVTAYHAALGRAAAVNGGEWHGQDAFKARLKKMTHPDAFKVPPLGITPSLLHSIDQSTKKGDTIIDHKQTFNINGHDPMAAMRAARLQASRGQQDLLRNLKGAEA